MIEEDVLYGMKKDPLAWMVQLDERRNDVRVVRRAAGAAGGGMAGASAAAAAAGSSEQVRETTGQIWVIRWVIGCVNPVSWPPLSVGCELTQSWVQLIAQFPRYRVESSPLFFFFFRFKFPNLDSEKLRYS